MEEKIFKMFLQSKKNCLRHLLSIRLHYTRRQSQMKRRKLKNVYMRHCSSRARSKGSVRNFNHKIKPIDSRRDNQTNPGLAIVSNSNIWTTQERFQASFDTVSCL